MGHANRPSRFLRETGSAVSCHFRETVRVRNECTADLLTYRHSYPGGGNRYDLYQNASSHFDTVGDSYRVYKEILKFSAASLISFLVDYGLYSLLSIWTFGLGSIQSPLISNIGARIVSACVNYTINRKLVFQSKAHVVCSAVQYAVLAGMILAGNTFVLGFLTDYLGTNRYVAKLATELFFFLISWMVQRRIIFQGGKNAGKSHKTFKTVYHTFVISRVYTVVTETEGGTGSGTSSTFTTDAEQKDETVPHTEAVLSETSYRNENIQIIITEYREYDTSIYVADIVLSSPEYLQTAFAQNAYDAM